MLIFLLLEENIQRSFDNKKGKSIFNLNKWCLLRALDCLGFIKLCKSYMSKCRLRCRPGWTEVCLETVEVKWHPLPPKMCPEASKSHLAQWQIYLEGVRFSVIFLCQAHWQLLLILICCLIKTNRSSDENTSAEKWRLTSLLLLGYPWCCPASCLSYCELLVTIYRGE